MLTFFTKRQIASNRKRAGVERWKQELLKTLLTQVIPPDEPYFYEAAFSFLQRDRTELMSPIRVTLFLPNYPLALDLIGVEGRANYLESRPYMSKPDWEDLQADLALKAEKLSLYRCPYLIIRDIDPIDAYSLRDRVKSLTGRRLRS